MEVVEQGYSVIHEELAGRGNYDPETVLEEVGEHMDDRISELIEDSETTVIGYLDAAFYNMDGPRFDPAMSYEPNGFIDEVEVDEVNGVFKVHGNGDVSRYWVPYMENETMCVFTDHFVPGRDPLEGIRFSFEGNVGSIPEATGDPQLKHDVATIYDAVEGYVADEWGISLLGSSVSSMEAEFEVDTSLIKGDLLAIREDNPELFEQATAKIDRIAADPIAQSEKIIEGERIYKINREYRLTGNVVSADQKTVRLKRFGHRTDVYSEEVDH